MIVIIINHAYQNHAIMLSFILIIISFYHIMLWNYNYKESHLTDWGEQEWSFHASCFSEYKRKCYFNSMVLWSYNYKESRLTDFEIIKNKFNHASCFSEYKWKCYLNSIVFWSYNYKASCLTDFEIIKNKVFSCFTEYNRKCDFNSAGWYFI